MPALLGSFYPSAEAQGAKGGASDRQTRVISLPANKPLSIEITVGAVRIVGSDRPDVEIVVERRASNAAQLAKLPLFIDDRPERVHVMAIQADGATDPAVRAEVVVRLPRAALIDRVTVIEGRVFVEQFAGTLAADVRRGAIDGANLSGRLRLETGIGDVTLTNAQLSADGLLRLRTFNGDVKLSLAQRPTDARIMALALNGHVRSEIPLTHRNTWGPRWGEATLGRGEPVISIDVVTGSVEIKSP